MVSGRGLKFGKGGAYIRQPLFFPSFFRMFFSRVTTGHAPRPERSVSPPISPSCGGPGRRRSVLRKIRRCARRVSSDPCRCRVRLCVRTCQCHGGLHLAPRGLVFGSGRSLMSLHLAPGGLVFGTPLEQVPNLSPGGLDLAPYGTTSSLSSRRQSRA